MLIDALCLLVGEQPGLTAAELSGALGTAASTVPEHEVLRLLFAAHGRFRSDSSGPARWWLADAWPGSTAAKMLPSQPAFMASSPLAALFDWQREALDAWHRRGHRGVVEAVTGAGKTRVGVAAVAEQLGVRGQALVLVPTKDLQSQWLGVLSDALPGSTRIGHLGDGGTASLASHDVVVAVINSLRFTDARPIRPRGLLVADECHRYASTFNRTALDPRFDRRLGLSATYARDDDGHTAWLDPYFGGTCFRLGYQRAVDDGVAARVAVALVGVVFEPYEREEYDELTSTMRAAAARLCGRWGVAREPFESFLRAVHALAGGSGDAEAVGLARRYRVAAHERRRVLAEARAKMDVLESLAPAVRAADRTIVFTQSISASEEAVSRLGARGVAGAAIHSALRRDDRADVLGLFASGTLRVVSAPRVLDEGVDVPAADLAIIIGASRSRRQMIQRMGRVLRRKPDGRVARFAVLFVEGTVEDPAAGAHEGFLGEITDVATTVRRFPSTGRREDVNELLSQHGGSPVA